MQRFFQMLFSVTKFYALGIANFLLFAALFYTSTYILKWHYIISSAISYSIVIVTAGLGNVFWVFNSSSKSSDHSNLILVFKTMGVYISSLFLELIALYTIMKFINGNVFIIQLIVYIVSSIYCFFMIHYKIFKNHQLVPKDY